MKIDPGMYIGLHLVFFGKTGVTLSLALAMEYKVSEAQGPDHMAPSAP
jgi:hypothetical protein